MEQNEYKLKTEDPCDLFEDRDAPTLADLTFPCKDCTWYIKETIFPLHKCWCTNKDKDGFTPIKWDIKTGWSCKKKEKEPYKQLEFDF